jgi:hypothetical protein
LGGQQDVPRSSFNAFQYGARNTTLQGGPMNNKYDIYKRLPEDRLLWINRVMGLDEARKLVAALQTATMESYLVYDFRERTIVDVFGAQQAIRNSLAA